jgi:hypothetical protein
MSSTEPSLSTPDSELIPPRPARGRGRPLLMSRDAVIERLRVLARGEPGLFRVHHRLPGLYARARRLFGTWSAAVAAAGLDYGSAIEAARARSLRNRRTRARRLRRAGA